MPADQLARLFGQLAFPVGQQLIEGRTSFSPGAGNEQRIESLLQVALGAGSQGMRPAPRHAKGGRKIGVIEVAADGQLDDLTLARLQLGKDAANQHPQFGLPGRVADIGRLVRQLARGIDLVTAARRPLAEASQAFVAGHRVQPRA